MVSLKQASLSKMIVRLNLVGETFRINKLKINLKIKPNNSHNKDQTFRMLITIATTLKEITFFLLTIKRLTCSSTKWEPLKVE
jgi:hypothetical protein